MLKMILMISVLLTTYECAGRPCIGDDDRPYQECLQYLDPAEPRDGGDAS